MSRHIMLPGVNAEAIAAFDLALAEQIRACREMRGRHQHEVDRMDQMIAFLESQRVDCARLGSQVVDRLAPADPGDAP